MATINALEAQRAQYATKSSLTYEMICPPPYLQPSCVLHAGRATKLPITISCSNLAPLLIEIPYTPFRHSVESGFVLASSRLAKVATMSSFDIWIFVFLNFIAAACLAFPSNPRSQSPILALTNDALPRRLSQVSLMNVGKGNPVYPITCFPSPSLHIPQLDTGEFLSDCYRIINEILLQQDGLLFQDLAFNGNTLQDQSEHQYLSQWRRGLCVINVSYVEEDQRQTLQLSNIVVAANKILQECNDGQRILQGGTTFIGSPQDRVYVGVLGASENEATNAHLLSNPNSARQDTRNTLVRTAPKFKSSTRGYGSHGLTISPPPSVRMEKRVPDPQPGSSLSPRTQSLGKGDRLSSLNLIVPSTDPAASIKVPPEYSVGCFNPYTYRLKPADVEDCQFVINDIILRYPNPMSEQTFGFTSAADIDLSLPENERWIFGRCAIFVRNIDRTRTDTFRMVDVAFTAHRIMNKCIIGQRYPVGGTCDVGSSEDNFYVGVGGVRQIPTTDATNTSITQ